MRANKFQSDFLIELTGWWLLSPPSQQNLINRCERQLWRVRRANDYPRGKARKKSERVAKGSTEEIPEDPSRKRCRSNPLYQSPRSSYFLHFPSFLEFFRLFAPTYTRRLGDITRRKHALYAYDVTRALIGARDIRGSQFIFSADSSKNFLWLVCRRHPDVLWTSSRLKGISRIPVVLFPLIRIEFFYRDHFR